MYGVVFLLMSTGREALYRGLGDAGVLVLKGRDGVLLAVLCLGRFKQIHRKNICKISTTVVYAIFCIFDDKIFISEIFMVFCFSHFIIIIVL